MTRKFQKITALLLAGILACFSLTACSDEGTDGTEQKQEEGKSEQPMNPEQLRKALDTESDYTITMTDNNGYTSVLKVDGKYVLKSLTNGDELTEAYIDCSKSSTATIYYSADGSWTTQDGAYSGWAEMIAELIRDVVPTTEEEALFDQSYYTANDSKSYTMNAEGLSVVGAESVTITVSGKVYTIKYDFWTITIDFSDVTITLPTVS